MSRDAARRLELRPLRESDAAALFEAIEASRAGLRRRFRWVDEVKEEQDCRAFIKDCEAAAASGGQFVFAIVETKTGVLAGVAALRGLKVLPGLAEAALWVRADRQDHGYAVEGGRLLLARAFRLDGLHRVWARIDPANRAARKVLQKLGFHYEGCLRREKRVNNRWVDQECWGLLRPEWKR